MRSCIWQRLEAHTRGTLLRLLLAGMLYSTPFTGRREASTWRSSIDSYIGLATYRALVEPYTELRKEICIKPFYVKLTLRHIFKGLMDDFE